MTATSDFFFEKRILDIENCSLQCWVSDMLEVLDGLRNMGCRCAWPLGQE